MGEFSRWKSHADPPPQGAKEMEVDPNLTKLPTVGERKFEQGLMRE